jgi:hypothetical protein
VVRESASFARSELTVSDERLAILELPVAPPVTRPIAAPLRRPKAPAYALLAIGVLLFLAPIAGGLFAKVAAGKQMLDQFAPHVQDDALARYENDLGVLRRGVAGIDAVSANRTFPRDGSPGSTPIAMNRTRSTPAQRASSDA